MDISENFIQAITIALPVWIPLAFVAYEVKRKRFGLMFFLAVVTAEAISIAIARPTIARIWF